MTSPGTPQIFISYARQDGRPTMEVLRDRMPQIRPGWRVWTDDLVDSRDRTFTLQIQHALDTSDAALFVITQASRESHWCEKEIEYAQTLRLPYVLVRPRPDVRPPFSLTAAPTLIDLPEDDEEAWGRLGRLLQSIGTPGARATAIEDARDRVNEAAAQATGVQRERLTRRGNELTASLGLEQERLADPAGAERRVRERIEVDLAVEREPAPDPADDPVISSAGVRLINNLPGPAPLRFHDRDDQLQVLKLLLAGSTTRLIALTGRDGIGKSALLTRLRDSLGHEELAAYRAVVFLDGCGHRRVTSAALLAGLAWALDEPASTAIRQRLDEPASSVDRLTTLLDALAERAVLVVVDGAEQLLDERDEFVDPDLREVCYELALRDGHAVRVLLVGQRPPGPLLRELGPRATGVSLDNGLPMPEAGEFLRTLDSANLLGAAGMDEAFLDRLRDATDGHPRSLELFHGILLAEGFTTPVQLLYAVENLEQSTKVADALFNRMLTDLLYTQLRVVEALAVYGRPVRAGGVDFVLKDVLDGVEAAGPLHQLENSRMARRDGDRYYLPPRDAERVVSRMERIAPETLATMRRRAADYHRDSRTPDEMVRQVADLDGHLHEIDMRVRIGEHEVALRLMAALDKKYLRRWGYSALILPLRSEVAAHLADPHDRVMNLSMAAAARSQQEQYAEAVSDLKAALRLVRWTNDLSWRVALWRQLGSLEQRRGDLGRANWLFRRALGGCVVLGMRQEQARSRLNLGLGLARTGNFEAALDQIGKGLAIGNRDPIDDEIVIRLWLNRGWVEGQQGRIEAALASNKRAHRIAHARGHEILTGLCRLRRAELVVNGDDPATALPLAEEAHRIGLVARDAALVCDASRTIALALLRLGRVEDAADAARSGMLHRGSGNAVSLYLLQGIVAFRRAGRRDPARAAFSEAFERETAQGPTHRRNYQAFNLRGTIVAGLALCGEEQRIEEAEAAFGRARKIVTAPGAVRRNTMLLEQFGESADPAVLSRLLRAAQG
ncbi:TIR domain-containing protein [Actinoplanes sp. TBRC 11911]|uniref:TIR domain-containing protein n=1 Tax=Actinoplanes sp. TBRC 11911 TaxID=2729386 RepID=UPI00145DFCF9|nr:TIR domain-containing protein [Actinoplanes sp. TBRC 11911]NMO57758.1 TIR domain-containing protein [Actinoplanes sp. TBRC 11911]